MNTILFLILQLAIVLFTRTVFAGPFDGPLVIKNGFPLYAAIGSPSLMSAEPDSTLDINFSYASTHRVKRSSDWYFGLDLETAFLDIQLKRLVGKETEIGIEIPIIRYGPGFMDNALETYHDLIGLRNAYNRNARPQNQFLLQIGRNGETVVQGKPGRTALGDIMAGVKHPLYDNHGSTIISAHVFLRVPTGDADSAFGSGKANGGTAVLINRKLRNDIMVYVNAGIGLIDSLEAMQAVELRNYYYGGVGLEWLYSISTSLNAQMAGQSSPFPGSGVYFIDHYSLLGSIGGRYRVDDLSSFGIAVTEDLYAAGAPDVMIGVNYRHQF